MKVETLHWRKVEEIDHQYVVFLPEGYEDSKEDWPLMVYIGGGADAERYKKHLTPIRQHPWVVLAPILPPAPEGTEGFHIDWNPQILGEIVRKFIDDYRIDKERVVLMGFSMGGSQAWQLPFWHRDIFSKVAAISGVCHPWKLKHYPKIPVQVFSGETEEFLQAHIDTVKMGKFFGVDVKHTIWPGLGHGECCNKTMRHQPLIDWLLS